MCYSYQHWSEESLMQIYDDDLQGGQMSQEDKSGKLSTMAPKLDQKNPLMPFIEAKSHQRSNVVNYMLWLPNLVRRIPNVSLK